MHKVPLSEVCDYSIASTEVKNLNLSNYITTDNLLPNRGGIVDATNLPPAKSCPKFEKDNILLSNIRPYFKKIWYASFDGGCSTDVLVLKCKNTKYHPKFVYYSLFQDLFFKHMMNSAKGSKMPRGDKDQILEFQIPDFDKPDQIRIADILSALDAKIALNTRINTELEQLARTIYKYWFVQFDFPTSAAEAASAGKPELEGKPYRSSGGEMVWNEELKRMVPKGWEVARLGDKLVTVLGGTPSTSVNQYWNDGEYHWLNSGEIANFPVISSELKITNEGITNSATELLLKGSTLLSITRHLRPTILAIDACANQSVVGIKESQHIKSYFIYPYLQNEIPRLMTLRTGAQQPHINKELVDSSLILLPSNQSEIMVEYNRVVEPFYKLLINNAFENHGLTCLRDFLLPLLMSGEVIVFTN